MGNSVMKTFSTILALVLLSLAAFAAEAPRGQTEGINAEYKSPSLDVKEWVERFEGESREVFALRKEIVAALDLQAGDSVADVGAGTGLFVPLLADRVGAQGKVYAVDIAPRFVEHIEKRAAQDRLSQVAVVLSNERSVELPANSVDMIFTSDAYHHFVHYRDMLASMREALKPGGQLIVVDFDIDAKDSNAWMRSHVGKSKATFRRQIEAGGFAFAQDLTLPGMKTNFMYRFTRK
jgi:cyclopropane fatty-acyl-phospholipid synthase-like methyltransferase